MECLRKSIPAKPFTEFAIPCEDCKQMCRQARWDLCLNLQNSFSIHIVYFYQRAHVMDKPTKKSACYEEIKTRILTLVYAPGAALDETQLSAEFDVSRTPLREVLQRLAGEGYVTITQNRGAVVSSMDLEVMRRFFQSAPMIYASVTRLAAEHASADQVGALREIQASFRKAVEDEKASEMVMLNHAFHAKIGEIADNPYLQPSLSRLLIDHTRMSQTFYRPGSGHSQGRIAAACDQHDSIIEAIAAHDPDKAVEMTLEHWELSRNEIELYARPDPLPVELASL